MTTPTLTDAECDAIIDAAPDNVPKMAHPVYSGGEYERGMQQRAFMESKRRALLRTMIRAAYAAGQAAASVAWDGPANLQIDSYATGRELVLAYINKDRIHLEVTDGSYQWRGSVSVPWNRAERAEAVVDAAKAYVVGRSNLEWRTLVAAIDALEKP